MERISTEKREKNNYGILAIAFMMLWFLAPIWHSGLANHGITTNLVAIAIWTIPIYFTFATGKIRLSGNDLKGILAFVLWAFLEFLYFNCYYSSHSYTTFFGIRMEVWAFFFFKMVLIIVPIALSLVYFEPNRKATRLMEGLFLLLLAVNLIYVVIAYSRNPYAIRTGRGISDAIESGLVGYAEVFGLALLLPLVMAGIYKAGKRGRILALGATAAVVIIAIFSNFTTAAILAIIGLLLMVYQRMRKGISKLIIFIFLALFILWLAFGTDSLLLLLNSMGADSVNGEKLQAFMLLFSGEGASGDLASRLSLYRTSLEAFAESPLIGGLWNPDMVFGHHSTVFDIMACTGLLGLLLFIASLVFLYKYCKTTGYYAENSSAVKTVFILFVLLVITKNTITSDCIYIIMFALMPVYFTIYKADSKER